MKYFNPDWRLINKAINEGELKELRAEENELKKKIQIKVDAYYKEKRERDLADKIRALKLLPIGSKVYYTGRSSDIKFGAEGIKLQDRRTRMSVKFDGRPWGVYYTNLKSEETTPQEKNSNEISTRLTKMVNGIL